MSKCIYQHGYFYLHTWDNTLDVLIFLWLHQTALLKILLFFFHFVFYKRQKSNKKFLKRLHYSSVTSQSKNPQIYYTSAWTSSVLPSFSNIAGEGRGAFCCPMYIPGTGVPQKCDTQNFLQMQFFNVHITVYL